MKKLICATLILVLTISIQFNFVILFERLQPTKHIELNATNFGLSYDDSIKSVDLSGLQGASFQKHSQALAQTFRGSNTVNVAITNAAFENYRHFEMIYGSFFTSEAEYFGLNIVIISDKLAFSLFSTENATGNKFTLNGIEYTVSGVFREHFLMRIILSNGFETIYLPTNSAFDMQFGGSLPIQNIFVTPDLNISPTFAEIEVLQPLIKTTHATDNYLVRNLTHSQRILWQFIRAELFAVFVVVAVLTLKFLVKASDFTYRNSDKRLKKILVLSAKWCVCVVVIILIYKLTAFEIFIPSKYISSNRLFDFSFYWGLIQTTIHEQKLHYAYLQSPNEHIYNFFFTLIFALTVPFLAALGKLAFHINKLLKKL